LIHLGRAHEVPVAYPGERNLCARALLYMGEYERVLREYPDEQRECVPALLRLGRYEEAAALLGDKRPDYNISCVFALREYQRRGGGAQEVFDSLLSLPHDFYGFSPELSWRFFMIPFLQMLDGDTAAFEKSIRTVIEKHRYISGQRLWHAAKYLAGEIDDNTFMAQPDRLGLAGELALLRALRADYRGEKGALQHYRRYQDLGYHLKLAEYFEDLFVKWRVRQLGGEGT
jgi:hypothetical protein